MQPLNPFTIPMQGQILIEASAGTGKTYTIALLFLRLLLEKKLSVDQILIVTFTKAAIRELRARVRLRIKEALACLRGEDSDDEVLSALLDNLNEEERETADIFLADALIRMDEAAIFTIHGFCQRMLMEHAFESGSPFTMEFIESEELLRRQIIEDFWRSRFYGIDQGEAEWVVKVFESPPQLLSQLRGHITRPGAHYIPQVRASEIQEGKNLLEPLFTQLRSLWQAEGRGIAALLYENKRLSRDKRKGYGINRLDEALTMLNRFFAQKEMPWLLEDENTMQLFTISIINSSLKKTGKGEAPVHHFFELFGGFLSGHARLVNKKRIIILYEAMAFLRAELTRRKRENGQFYFDDLLTELAEVIDDKSGHSPARAISKKYPAILIDEFQDTDQLQYRIFTHIHKSGKGGVLFLIADPKQAIYGFRGADIFTYIKARADTRAKDQFTMTSNYRSTGKMVEFMNRLFSRRNPFLFAEIDFSPVKAAGRADETPFTIRSELVAPLHWLILPAGKSQGEQTKALSKEKAQADGADLCAEKIAFLLAMGKSAEAMIGGQPLSGGDIAVLVRTHREAEIMRRSLCKLGIISVYISQNSVFASSEAEQLFMVLSGLHALVDSSLVSNLLTTDLFGYTAQALDQLRGDESKWAEMMTRLNNYLQIWKQQGLLSAFYRLIDQENTVQRILAGDDGERKLTNYLHLVEFLQEVSGQFPEPERLLGRFREEIEGKDIAGDSQQLRLESERNLVKLITIHKAKGLEYSLIFLPFLWSARICKKKEPLLFHSPKQPELLLVDLGSGDEDNYEQAEKERLAEDLRLLYVALTRAKYSCFICWGWVSKMEDSALNYLLHDGLAPSGGQAVMDELELSGGELVYAGERPALMPAMNVKQEPQVHLSPSVFNGYIDNRWRLFSYSGLMKDSSFQGEQPDYDRFDQLPAEINDTAGFPRGAAAGICIHAILESIDFTDPAGHRALIEKQLTIAGYDEKLIPLVCKWIKKILTAKLLDDFSLSKLKKQDRIDEMAFSFPLDQVNLVDFNQILTKFSIPVLNLEGKSLTMHGLMRGFIDLIYRYEGRFFIVDYKSNYLGAGPDDYNRQNLALAVVEHRYDIQYLLYTLALHRYLDFRLPDYDYQQHLGGIQYLFLRGMGAEKPVGRAVFSELPSPELIRELDYCLTNR